MQIQITGQGMDVTKALRELTVKKLERCVSYIEKVNHFHVTLKVDNNAEQTASATVTVPGSIINAHAKSEDMYKSIDMLAHNLQAQLKKYKEKMTDHHQH
jgi:putative sigma-54 modulation protein